MRLFSMLVVGLLVGDIHAGHCGKGRHGSRGCSQMSSAQPCFRSCGSFQSACSTGQCGVNTGVTCLNGQCQVAPLAPVVKDPVLPAPVPMTATKTETTIKEKKNKTVIKTRTTTAALDVLNQQRAQRGLRPYVFDEGLTRAAEKCASIRAANHIEGHLGGNMSDFACLEPGVQCSCTGAGALTPDWGFATCAMYEHWTYAGAAAVMGNDGKQYCSLFVR